MLKSMLMDERHDLIRMVLFINLYVVVVEDSVISLLPRELGRTVI